MVNLLPTEYLFIDLSRYNAKSLKKNRNHEKGGNEDYIGSVFIGLMYKLFMASSYEKL